MQDKSSAKVLRGSSPERLGEWDPPHTLMEESHCTSPESPNVYKPCSRRPTLLTQTSHPPRLEIPPTKGAVPRGQCKPLISMQTQPLSMCSAPVLWGTAETSSAAVCPCA